MIGHACSTLLITVLRVQCAIQPPIRAGGLNFLRVIAIGKSEEIKVVLREFVVMARFGGAVMRGISPRRSWQPLLRRAYGNYEEFDVFAGADTAEKVRINGYDENKFYANGVEVEGAIICLSRLTLKWTPKSFEEVTPDSLALFELLRPAPEILILGCGKRMGRVSQEVRDYLRSNGIKLEAIDTANATSTFNILNEEGRIVAAAMLPQGT